jgi:GDP-4-dehydro-6-deoxy-D-mannose reductase
MTIALVTGGTGVLGRAVVERLRRDTRHRVVIASLDAAPGEDAIRLDLRRGDEVAAVVARLAPALVLHLAATFTDDFDEAYAVNVAATRGLLEALARAAVPARVVLVGSAAEYGVVRPAENPVGEARALAPVSTYGLTKSWQTLLGGLYAARGVDVVTARVFNLDGPGLSERLFVGRVQKQIAELAAGQRAAIELGPLDAVRDYIDVEAAADQLLAIAARGERGQVYHVASGVPVTMRDVLGRYLARHGLAPGVVKSGAELSNHRGYDVPAIWADVARTTALVRAGRAGG